MPAFDTPRADEFLALIRERLPDKTYKHCVSVARFMRDHAHEAGITQEQAVTAGLLHDSCKAMNEDELLEFALELGMDTVRLREMTHTIWHGPISAQECRTRLYIADEAVCDAIEWHTTGRPAWTNLGLALYLADYSEPRRKHPEAERARDILDTEGFAAAVKYVAKAKTDHVARKHTLDPATLEFRRWVETEWP